MAVLNGAIAIIRIAGTVVGRMRNIRATENISRADVGGIGTIFTIEAPVVKHSGTLSCDFYEVDYKLSPIANAIRRDVQTNQQFQDQLTLIEGGITLDIFKKISDLSVDPSTGLVIPQVVPYASIRRVLIESDGFDISEGAVAGRSGSFRFLDPIIFPQ